MSQIKIFTFNLLQEHTMVAWTSGPSCLVVDPSFYSYRERTEFLSFLDSEGLTPEAVILTHGHIDHVGGVKFLQDRYGIPVHMDPRERLSLDNAFKMAGKLGLDTPDTGFSFNEVKEGEVLKIAGLELEVISTPGHSPGSTCYLERKEKFIFTGDTLFAGTIGRTDLDMYGDYDLEMEGICTKLMPLDSDTRIYPGHGDSSTIGRESTHNPFLEPFNLPEPDPDSDLEPIVIRPDL